HGRGLIYRGYDAMPWCPRCGVGISQMEMHEGYQLVAHRAPFIAFPLRGRPKENLLIWTTTPWTLTSNVAAAVNPELRYLKRQLHRVIAWKDVGEAEGTGIVHIAPGCGAEDNALGRAEHLVAVAPLDEGGIFVPGYGALEGKYAVDQATTDTILGDLKNKGVL